MAVVSGVSGQRFNQIVTASNADRRLEVFLLDQVGDVYHRYQKVPNGGWTEWSVLGGTYMQSLFVESNNDGRLELFALGGDGSVYHKWQVVPNGGWTGWASQGGTSLKQLSATKNADGRLELFVLGGDNAIWHKWQTAANGGWSEWALFGGTDIKSFVTQMNADGRLELFALGGDKSIWHKSQTTANGGWNEWSSLGGSDLQQICVGRNADGRLELFALGGDKSIWHKWQTTPNGGWSEWASFGGTALKKIQVATNVDGRLELFALGGDNAFYHKWQAAPNGGWNEWAPLGGSQMQDFAVGRNADGRLELFALATDDAVWQKWQLVANGNWGEWSHSVIPELNKKNELAFHYAPIHYQDTDDSKAKADYITSVNYDNNWITSDNWDNLDNFPLSATVYYSFAETCTHWYLSYLFYHPRDWDESGAGEHENDLEGIILMVRKDGTPFGKLEGTITIAHWYFYSFVPPGSTLSEGDQDIDGAISFFMSDGLLHPVTSQEAKGHGLKAYGHTDDFRGKDDEDGIIYYPSRYSSQVPKSGNDRHVLYKLEDIFTPGGLWDHQLSDLKLPRDNASVFAGFGVFKGDFSGGCGLGTSTGCGKDGADAPWNWDGKDVDSRRGDFALDPANLFQKFYSGLGQFDTRYISNKYVSDLQTKGFNSSNKPRGWNDAINMNTLFTKLIGSCP